MTDHPLTLPNAVTSQDEPCLVCGVRQSSHDQVCEVPACNKAALTYSVLRLWWVCSEHAYRFERERHDAA